MSFRHYLLLSLVLLAGCQVPGEIEKSELTILKRSNQCRLSLPVLRELKSMDEINRIFKQESMLQKSEPLPDLDLSVHAIMLLAMGQKPTAGYRIEFDSNKNQYAAGILRLSVKFAPPAGDIAATVLASPCLIFAIKREGLSEIVAGDTGLVYRF
jgi:hypothetical protein